MSFALKQNKKRIVGDIKKVLEKYGVKATVFIRNMKTVCIYLKSGPIDFHTSYSPVSAPDIFHEWKNVQRDFFVELFSAANQGNYNTSHISDKDMYYNAWHIDISIGTFTNPYIVEK